MKNYLMGFLVICFTSMTFAHVKGHGPKVEGKGLLGGKLSAVVSAKEADLGVKAEHIYTAETLFVNDSASVYLFSKDRKELKQVPSEKAKVIALSEGKKPDIFEVQRTSDAYTFKTPQKLSEYSTIEDRQNKSRLES